MSWSELIYFGLFCKSHYCLWTFIPLVQVDDDDGDGSPITRRGLKWTYLPLKCAIRPALLPSHGDARDDDSDDDKYDDSDSDEDIDDESDKDDEDDNADDNHVLGSSLTVNSDNRQDIVVTK